MGIKTRFNPMGGDATGGGEPRPSIPDAWSYTTRTNETGKEVRTLYFYNNTLAGTEQVTVPYGHTELQDYQYSTHNSYSTLPFFNHSTLTSVNLNNVPFRNGSMDSAFAHCTNLLSVNNINENTTNMDDAFYYCQKFNYNIQIPNNVISMSMTFRNCFSFNQSIVIPNSVNSVYGCFQNCYNLNSNVQLSNNINSISSTFRNCTNLNQNIKIPDNVWNLSGAFYNCKNLNQNIKIPNNTTTLASTFEGCHSINQAIQIPNKVDVMTSTFSNCYNLRQNFTVPNKVTMLSSAFKNCNSLGSYDQPWSPKTITIYSSEISYTNNAFYGTSADDMTNQLRVVFPMRYINNVNTVTRNTLVASGYAVGTGLNITAANATEFRNIQFWDAIPLMGYSTYVGNGTHWQLTKWDESKKGTSNTQVIVPETITTYDTFPTALNISTFTLNADISYLKISNNTTWVSNRTGVYKNSASYAGAFRRMYNLKTADISIAEGVLGMQESFRECNNLTNIKLTIPTTATDLRDLFTNCTNLVNARSHDGDSTMIGIVPSSQIVGKNVGQVRIPDSATRLTALYSGCNKLDTVIIDSKKAIYVEYLLDHHNTRDVNVYINSPDITTITNWQRGYSTAYTKNYYIPYMNSDGTYTETYNAFNGQAIMRNDATSNFRMYDISPYNSIADYVVTVNFQLFYYNSYRGMSKNPVVLTNQQIPFKGRKAILLPTTFYNKNWVESIDCSNVPFLGETMLNAFRLCSNVKTIKNINAGEAVTSMAAAFYDDPNLESIKNFYMPNSVTNVQSIYGRCKSLSNMYINGFGVTKLAFACDYCNTRPINVYVKSPNVTGFTNMFRGHNTAFRKNVYIYFKYANGVATKTFNLFKPVLYTGTTGNTGSVSPMYNSTSNFYIYNLGTCPV